MLRFLAANLRHHPLHRRPLLVELQLNGLALRVEPLQLSLQCGTLLVHSGRLALGAPHLVRQPRGVALMERLEGGALLLLVPEELELTVEVGGQRVDRVPELIAGTAARRMISGL